MVCPRCLAQAVHDYRNTVRAVDGSYGHVSMAQFERLRAGLGKPPTVATFKEELREDYKIGITDTGEFYVKYSGSCQKCRFGHTFEQSVQLEITVAGVDSGQPSR
jgi:hypothetical protein